MSKIPGKQSPLQFIDNVTIKANGTNKLKVKDVGQQVSLSSGNFETVSTSYVDVTNLTVTITTNGRPVMLVLVPDGTANENVFSVFNNDGLGHVYNLGWYKWLKNGSDLSYDVPFGSRINVSSQPTANYITPPSFLDTPVAGTYTYKIQVKRAADPNASGVQVKYFKLIAYEL